jgi:hypothetical protein
MVKSLFGKLKFGVVSGIAGSLIAFGSGCSGNLYLGANRPVIERDIDSGRSLVRQELNESVFETDTRGYAGEKLCTPLPFFSYTFK